MNAKEAREASDAAAKKIVEDSRREQQAAEERRVKDAQWQLETVLPEMRALAKKVIAESIAAGGRRAHFHYTSARPEMLKLLIAELVTDGYVISQVGCETYEATHDGDNGWMAGGSATVMDISW